MNHLTPDIVESVLLRLRRCDEYLSQGRYPEAIHLASQPPPVLEVLCCLNLSQARSGNGVTPQWPWSLPPHTIIQLAERLNLAFGIYPQVEALFREYRHLTLLGALPGKRLQILREIKRQLNTLYPAIDKQIRELEAERLKTIDAELQSAIQRRDSETIQSLYQELADSGWSIPARPDLLQMATTYLQNQHAQQLRQHLDRIGQRLKRVMQQRDLDTAQQLLQEWNQVASQLGLTPADELWMRYRQALNWATELSEVYAVATKPDVTTQELAGYEEVIFRWRKFLPARLEQTYEQALSEAQVAETRWRQTMVAVAILICLLVFAAVIYVLVTGRRPL